MKDYKKTILIVIFSIILGLLSYFLFSSINPLLTTTALFTFDINSFLNQIILPLISISIFLYTLTFALTLTKSYYVIVLIPIVYIVSQNFSITSILISIGIAFVFYLFSKFYFDDLDNFKRPSISRCINISFGIPLTLFSLLLVLNYIPLYSSIINSDNIQIDKSFIDLANQFTQGLGSSAKDSNINETVREFAINTLHKQDVPINEKNVEIVENQLRSQLDVDAKETDKISDLQSKVLIKKLQHIIKANKTLALYGLIFIIFLLIQFFIKFGAFLSKLFIYPTELILKYFHIRFLEKIPSVNTQTP